MSWIFWVGWGLMQGVGARFLVSIGISRLSRYLLPVTSLWTIAYSLPLLYLNRRYLCNLLMQGRCPPFSDHIHSSAIRCREARHLRDSKSGRQSKPPCWSQSTVGQSQMAGPFHQKERPKNGQKFSPTLGFDSRDDFMLSQPSKLACKGVGFSNLREVLLV